MAKLFKDEFHYENISVLSNCLSSGDTNFQKSLFVEDCLKNFESAELKQRSQKITQAMHEHLSTDFSKNLAIILSSLAPDHPIETTSYVTDEHKLQGWIMMPVCDYISEAALQRIDSPTHPYFLLALNALKECTKRFSSEFAIRPFLKRFPDETLKFFHSCLNDQSAHIRRWVSEGSRPLLPWGMKLDNILQQPHLTAPLLEALKDDDSQYVRRSVANHLNDFSRTQSQFLVDLAKNWWDEANTTRTQLIKHACRTLIKQGNKEIMNLMGFAPPKLEGVTLELAHSCLMIGDKQTLIVSIKNPSPTKQKLMIDFKVFYQKANKKLSGKVFKWKQITIKPDESISMSKSHAFKDVSIRKHYTGKHIIELLINGEVFASAPFDLTQGKIPSKT